MMNVRSALIVAIVLLSLTASLVSGAVVTVHVKNFLFIPSSVIIQTGDTVEWVWLEGEHTIASHHNEHDSFEAVLGPDAETFSKVFNLPGTYRYASEDYKHLGMTATVVVWGAPIYEYIPVNPLVPIPSGPCGGEWELEYDGCGVCNGYESTCCPESAPLSCPNGKCTSDLAQCTLTAPAPVATLPTCDSSTACASGGCADVAGSAEVCPAVWPCEADEVRCADRSCAPEAVGCGAANDRCPIDAPWLASGQCSETVPFSFEVRKTVPARVSNLLDFDFFGRVVVPPQVEAEHDSFAQVTVITNFPDFFNYQNNKRKLNVLPDISPQGMMLSITFELSGSPLVDEEEQIRVEFVSFLSSSTVPQGEYCIAKFIETTGWVCVDQELQYYIEADMTGELEFAIIGHVSGWGKYAVLCKTCFVDCHGEFSGSSQLDACNVCDGDSTTCADCFGEPNGPAVLDACGVCDGDNSTCCNNYLGVEDRLWDFVLLPVAVDELIEKLHNLRSVLEWVSGELPTLEQSTPVRVGQNKVGDVAEINRLFLKDCGLVEFCASSANFLDNLQLAIDWSNVDTKKK